MDFFKNFNLDTVPEIDQDAEKLFLKIINFFDLKKIGKKNMMVSTSKDEENDNDAPVYPEYIKSELEDNLIYAYSSNSITTDWIPSLEYIDENWNKKLSILGTIISKDDLKDQFKYEQNRINVKKEIFDPHFFDIVSLNNFLYINHDAILKTAPFILKKTRNKNNPVKWEDNFDQFENFYDLIPRFEDTIGDEIHYEHGLDDEWLSEYDGWYESFYIDECKRWTEYNSTYIPGFTLSSAMIYIEKFLINISKICVEKGIAQKDFYKQNKVSIIDGRLKHLKEHCGLEFEIPSDLAEIIFKARVARNMFSHGNWKEIQNTFLDYSASQVVGSCYKITLIICLSLQKKFKNMNLLLGEDY